MTVAVFKMPPQTRHGGSSPPASPPSSASPGGDPAPQVPGLAAKHAEQVLAAVLERRGLRRADLAAWILHAGGREVLVALGAQLGVPAADLARSAEVLRGHGNLSSPFVLFVLRDALATGAPGGLWWMASFGAGFTSHGALLEVEDDPQMNAAGRRFFP